LGPEFEIGFGGIQTSPAFEIAHHDQQVDFSIRADGFIQSGQQNIIIFCGHFAAHLETNARF